MVRQHGAEEHDSTQCCAEPQEWVTDTIVPLAELGDKRKGWHPRLMMTRSEYGREKKAHVKGWHEMGSSLPHKDATYRLD